MNMKSGDCPDPREPEWLRKIIRGVPEGIRHISAVRIVGRYYALGLPPKAVEYILKEWNRHNAPPMSDYEVQSIISSTRKWAHPY